MGRRQRQQMASGGAPKRDPRGHGAAPPSRRDAAVLALLEHRSVADAARQCGVSERTLFRWTSEDEAFRRELAAARRAVFDAGMSRVQALTGRAVEALEDCLASDKASVKLQAARTTLELAAYRHEAEAIVAKLTAVEAQLLAQSSVHGGRHA
jgi:transposase-like protein